jgi:hypothetical protein
MMTAQVLEKARELYAAAPSHAPTGHVPEDGTTCMLLAIIDAQEQLDPEGYSDCPPFMAAVQWILHGKGYSRGLIRFNAEHSTEEVLAVFDEAIAAALEDEE